MVDALLELCRDIGIPEKLIMDGDGAQNNPQVLRIVNDYMIKVHNSEPENQQQNRAERGGATVKQGLRRLHFETRFDLAYWNYAVVHFCDCFNHTACRELGWQCRLEKLHGPTQDISVFRFVFWSLVWFWDPHIKFPASQWRLGRFLGRAKNVGDPFTFWIKPIRQESHIREPPVVARSVVRECVDEESAPPDANDCVDLPVADLILPSRPTPSEPLESILESEESLESDIPDPVDGVSPTELSTDDIESMSQIDAAAERLLVNQIFPESVELEDCIEGVETPVRPLDDCFDSEELFPGQSTDSPSDTDSPPVVTQDDDNAADEALHFDDPEDESAAAEVINNTFCHLRDADGAPCDFVDILSHRGTSVSTLELELLWSNGMKTWAKLADVQADQPSLVAKYVLANKIEGDKSGTLARWARVALRTLKRSIRRIYRAYRMATVPGSSMSADEWSSIPTQPRIRRSTNAPARRPSSSDPPDRSKSNKSKKKKAGRNNRHLGEVKYGVRIP
jgi:hypothetical protein